MNLRDNRDVLKTDRSNHVIDYLVHHGVYEEDGVFDTPVHEMAKRAIKDFLPQATEDEERRKPAKSGLSAIQNTSEILDAYVEGAPEIDLHYLFTELKRVIPHYGIDIWAEAQLARYVKIWRRNREAKDLIIEQASEPARDIEEVLEATLSTQEATRAYSGQLRLLFGKVKAPKETPEAVILMALQQGSSRLRRDIRLLDREGENLPLTVKEGCDIIREVVGHSVKDVRPLLKVIVSRSTKDNLPLEEVRTHVESMLAHTILYLYGDKD